MTDTTVTTIKSMAEDVLAFHKAEVIPFDDTTMTVPTILFHALKTKHNDARKYLKNIASETKTLITTNGGVTEEDLTGKLSTKIQERVWRELIGGKAKVQEMDITDFQRAIVIPYECNGLKTTMTVNYFLYEEIKSKFMKKNASEQSAAKDARNYFKEKASSVKAEMILKGVPESELRGKVSAKVAEIVYVELLPAKVKNSPVNI